MLGGFIRDGRFVIISRGGYFVMAVTIRLWRSHCEKHPLVFLRDSDARKVLSTLRKQNSPRVTALPISTRSTQIYIMM